MRMDITALLALTLVAGTVQAADNGIYIGAGVGQANVDIDDPDLDVRFDGDDTGYKLIVGIRPLDWLAIEASYVDFGTVDDTVQGVRLESDADGLSAFAVGLLPVGPVDVFAKVGLINWDVTLKAPEFDASVSDDGTDLAYGVGVQFRVWSLGLRAEYEIFDIEDTDDVNMISLGLTWTFL